MNSNIDQQSMNSHHLPAPNFVSWANLCASQMRIRKNCVSGDLELAKQHVSQVTHGRSHFFADSKNKANAFSSSVARLSSATFHFFRWDCDAKCQIATFRKPEHNVVLFIPLKGSFQAFQGDQAKLTSPGELLLAGSGGESIRRWQGVSELLSVCIARRALERTLAEEFVVDPRAQRLTFEPLLRINYDKVCTLLRVIETTICDLNSPMPVFSSPVVNAHLERTLLNVFLKSIPNNYSDLIDGRSGPAPYYVRRAESFILSRLREEIAIKALTDASGVSVRTLYYGFQKYRGLSPSKYIKRARLMMAHELLKDARLHGGRVADIAARSGYRSQSQFSRDYKSHFGTSPLATLSLKQFTD
jgi:AraC-like DNA-binding protein